MTDRAQKSKMTLDKLAKTTQWEFLSMDKKVGDIRENMATKKDLEHFATKVDLGDLKTELKDDIQKGTVEVLRAVDKIVVKFDKAEKDHAADKLLHDRHEKRLEKIETRIGIKA